MTSPKSAKIGAFICAVAVILVVTPVGSSFSQSPAESDPSPKSAQERLDFFYKQACDIAKAMGRKDISTKLEQSQKAWEKYRDTEISLETADADLMRTESDLLYRSVAITATDNSIVEAYDTDAYGNTLCYSGPGSREIWFTDDDVTTNNPINTTIFTGRQYDPESQSYYYRARYYSPNIGRFISRDPIGEASDINLYGYALSKPVNKLDPQGLCCEDEWASLQSAGAAENAALSGISSAQRSAAFDVAVGAAAIAVGLAALACAATVFTEGAAAVACARATLSAAVASAAAIAAGQYNAGAQAAFQKAKTDLVSAQNSYQQALMDWENCTIANVNTLPCCPCV